MESTSWPERWHRDGGPEMIRIIKYNYDFSR